MPYVEASAREQPVVTFDTIYVPARVPYYAHWTGKPTAEEIAVAELSGLMDGSDIA